MILLVAPRPDLSYLCHYPSRADLSYLCYCSSRTDLCSKPGFRRPVLSLGRRPPQSPRFDPSAPITPHICRKRRYKLLSSQILTDVLDQGTPFWWEIWVLKGSGYTLTAKICSFRHTPMKRLPSHFISWYLKKRRSNAYLSKILDCVQCGNR